MVVAVGEVVAERAVAHPVELVGGELVRRDGAAHRVDHDLDAGAQPVDAEAGEVGLLVGRADASRAQAQQLGDHARLRRVACDVLALQPAPLDKLDDVPMRVVIPAFIISELKTAFQIGFMLFLPFLIIDLVVASILMAMGMMMLSPMIVSLPFKLMLFVLVDGWSLIMGTLMTSFGIGVGGT